MRRPRPFPPTCGKGSPRGRLGGRPLLAALRSPPGPQPAWGPLRRYCTQGGGLPCQVPVRPTSEDLREVSLATRRSRGPRPAAGVGACPRWPSGALQKQLLPLRPQDPGPIRRLSPGGSWHVAAPRGRSFIPPILQRRKLRSGMALSARPKSCSWFGPSPDFESEAHGPCRPGRGGPQA